MTMHPQAYHAIRAAKNLRVWGRYATRRYLEKNNVPMSLYTLARVLEAAEGINHVQTR